MIDLGWKIGAFLVVLGTLVVFHELGHYVVARWCGVKVLRFSIGFGRVVWSRRVGPDRTEWAVSAIPLGGYVKMADEREDDLAPADRERAFNRQNVWKRIAIVAAGPVANLLLAVLLFAGTFMAGVPGQRALLAPPPPGTAAAAAGFVDGDRVVAVDGVAVASLAGPALAHPQVAGTRGRRRRRRASRRQPRDAHARPRRARRWPTGRRIRCPRSACAPTWARRSSTR